MARYIALIRKEPKSCFGIDFPDFPGCISAGDTLEEAIANAHEGLAAHIELLLEYGDTLPAPGDLDKIMADPHNRGAAAVLIDAPQAAGRTARVNITLDESVLRRIDAAAERIGTSRSGFLARAALDRIGQLEDSTAAPYAHGPAFRKHRTQVARRKTKKTAARRRG